MSTFKHALGILAAGLLAFAGVAGSHLLTAEDPGHSEVAGSEHDDAPSVQAPSHGSVGSGALSEQILGRWRAPEPANQDAFVEFTEYGLWYASDGCNSAAGAWRIDGDGSFTNLGRGAMTQIGCDNVPIPEAVWGAKHAEIDAEGRLMLADGEGAETVLLRTDDEPFTLEGRWVGPASATALSVIDFDPDGTWRGTAGCSELGGTWTLEAPGSQHVELPGDGQAATIVATAPGVLRIGAAEPRAECLDADSAADLALDPDTEYGFWLGSSGAFSISRTDPASALEQPVTFYRVEQPKPFGE